MKALYRKYRPISLETVISQDQVVSPLKEALKSGKISHAYLFCGPRGTGKTSIARIFAHEINGFKYELEDSYVDIIEIDAASNTGVDNIRDLREMALVAPTEGKYKIYIIDEIHMLSKSAFNALLKLMEEPPAHVIFVMATTNPEKVPITITSRAQTYTFRLADADTMLSHIKSIAASEKIPIEDDALKVVVARGGGSFRDTISLLDQISNLAPASGSITSEMVDSALGLPASQKITELLSAYESGDSTRSTEIVRELLNSGSSAENLATALVDAIVANPTPALLHLVDRLFNVSAPFAEAKLTVAFFGPGSAPASASIAQGRTPVSVAQNPVRTPAPAAQSPVAISTPTASTPAVHSPAAAPVQGPAPTDPVTASSETQTTLATQSTALDLSASDFLSSLAAKSSALTSIVEKGKLEISTNSVDIYPSSRGFHKILTSDKNLKLLQSTVESFVPGAALHIHEPGESPQSSTAPQSDSANSAKITENSAHISDIMGVEVQPLDSSESPF